MQQVAALDAQTLAAETPSAPGHVGALLILDPSTTPAGTLTPELFRDLCETRLHRAPRLRQRLVEVPLGLGRPYWVDDRHFDIEYHVRQIGLPTTDDPRQLAELVSGIHSRPLDRARPLWQAYLIQGLDRGRTAIYTKVHHTVIDPETGVDLLTVVLDGAGAEPPEGDLVGPEWRPASVPGQPRLLARGLTSSVGRLLRSPPRTVPHLIDLPGVSRIPGSRVASDIADSVISAATHRLSPSRALEAGPTAPSTPLNAAVTAHRRLGYGSVPLAEIERLATVYGHAATDVAAAMITTALRRWLLDHDALPELPLVAAVLVSALDQDARPDPSSCVLRVQLPTHVANPEQRLIEVARSMAVAAERVPAVPVATLRGQDVPAHITLWGLTARAQFREVTAARPCNVSVSLVAGPQSPLYVAGARVDGIHPIPGVTAPAGGLNVGLVGYAGRLDLGLVACRELVPDVWNLIGYCADALDELARPVD